MNRYSMIFALLVASSFAVRPPQAGDSATSPGNAKASALSLAKTAAVDPAAFIKGFLDKAQSDPAKMLNLRVLFATVPHPIETHLASAFDHNVDALQDGLQQSGYLFDSAWIPWNFHGPRETYGDDEQEKSAKKLEDNSPGILLFRKDGETNEAYSKGVVVFLITEKPTEGIAYSEVKTAVQILADTRIEFSGTLRILGPSYSGSFASLVPVVKYLHEMEKDPKVDILIRSGTATGGQSAIYAMQELKRLLPGTWVDFGSARSENAEWINSAAHALGDMGIPLQSIATLSEGESAYGHWMEEDCSNRPRAPDDRSNCKFDKESEKTTSSMWRLAFPRNISSLRTGYEKQGIFDSSTSAPPWKRFLNLKSDEQNDGDSVRTFGRETTDAAQESILFGISEFLKTHGIRAVVISATNEQDRLFLAQFLHAHNLNVRVVLIGSTRIFMRGAMSQFRGDMMVDDFPMLPRLHDWTWGDNDRTPRIFADSASEGVYFAAIDLLDEPHSSGSRIRWHSEYSEPGWDEKFNPVLRPPMYVSALGSDSAWPVAEDRGMQFPSLDPDSFRVQMPFTLFDRNQPTAFREKPFRTPPQIHVGHHWKLLFFSMAVSIVISLICFWYARPVCRGLMASFEPCAEWRFWVFKVTIPSLVAGAAMRVMAWSVDIPAIASTEAVSCWRTAQWMSLIAPLGIAIASTAKSYFRLERKWTLWMSISFLPALGFFIGMIHSFVDHARPILGSPVGSILVSYREMHWESGLSLLPTILMFLLAFMVWSAQAGNGAASLDSAPQLPDFPRNGRISQARAKKIVSIARPLPLHPDALWLWITWLVMTAGIALAHFRFRPFLEITTLASHRITFFVRGMTGTILALILLDIFQFVWLWSELRGLLRALDRESFRRSFVPINDFNWRSLWSVTGTSLHDWKAVLGSQIDCLADLNNEDGIAEAAAGLNFMRKKYTGVDLCTINSADYRKDLKVVYASLARIGTVIGGLLDEWKKTEQPQQISPDFEALQRALSSQGGKDSPRFGDEAEELARLPQKIRTAERFLCLMYIGFIQAIVARLHTLLVSVASIFSLTALGIAIYPFAPLSPFLLVGLGTMLLIAWAFFKIFSEMDKDPVLSRIVNGDDRRLQGNFYVRFAEAVALPLLTLGSSLLPGGTGRLLELAQTLLNHSQ